MNGQAMSDAEIIQWFIDHPHVEYEHVPCDAGYLFDLLATRGLYPRPPDGTHLTAKFANDAASAVRRQLKSD